jgi:hypothetical protein
MKPKPDYTAICNAPVAIIYINADGLLTWKRCTARWTFLSVQGERNRGVKVVATRAVRSPLERLAKHPRDVTDLHAFKSRAMV